MATPPQLDSFLVADLEQKLGTASIFLWIEQRTTELARLGWRRAGWIDLRARMLDAVTVKRIRVVSKLPANVTACLKPLGRGEYEILVRPVQDWKFQRFWIAHEIGHTFWLQPGTDGVPISSLQRGFESDPTIERLCSYAAAALLMPRRLLELKLDAMGHRLTPDDIDLAVLPILAGILHVPWQMVVHRWLHEILRLPVSVILLKRIAPGTVRVVREVAPPGEQALTYRGKVVKGVKPNVLREPEAAAWLAHALCARDRRPDQSGKHAFVSASPMHFGLIWRCTA